MLDLPGGRLEEPRDRIRDGGRARSTQPEEPEALTGPHLEADVLGRAEGRPDGEPANDEPRPAVGCGRTGGIVFVDRVRELSADHRADQPLVVELRHGSGDDPLPVAEHGRAVAKDTIACDIFCPADESGIGHRGASRDEVGDLAAEAGQEQQERPCQRSEPADPSVLSRSMAQYSHTPLLRSRPPSAARTLITSRSKR